MIRVKPKTLRELRPFIAVGLMALSATTASASSNDATVVVGGKPVPFVVSPYVASDGQVYIPVDVVRVMGASYAPNADGRTVKITTAAGTTFDAPFQFVQSRFCVPLQRYADQLGATAIWDARSRTMTFRAKLVLVRADAGGLTVDTSYPVYYKVQKLDKSARQDPERRVFVDLYGVDLGSAPASIPSNQPQIAYIRTGTLAPGVVRVVVDLRRRLAYRVDSGVSTDQIHVAMAGLGPSGVPPIRTANPPHVAVVPHPSRPAPPIVAPPVQIAQTVAPLPVTAPAQPETPTAPVSLTPVASSPLITGITYRVISPEVTEVTVKSSAPAKYRWVTLDAPYRLAFDLAGAGLQSGLQASQDVPSPVVKDVRAGTINAGKSEFGRVVIDLAQAVDFSVTTQQDEDGMTYTISLQRPAEAPITAHSDELHGKVIMVDAGHGADDTGALDRVSGYREKDFNLQIAKKVRDTLARHGATVYMTREDDIKPSLSARPKMAIAVGADYFISIHCDESGAQNQHSGTTVYYHAQNPTCRQLAMNIVNRVAAVSGLPGNGVKSDTIRFHTGFAVLRGSPMPAVLVECGYMNNSNDVSKLRTDDVQQHIADGVTAGLIDFIRSRG